MSLLQYLRKEWLDFVDIWNSNQSQEGLDACKIHRGSVIKCSIYVHSFLNFVCL